METEFVSHAKIIIAGRTEKTSFQVLNGEECVCVCMHARTCLIPWVFKEHLSVPGYTCKGNHDLPHPYTCQL